MDVVSPRVPKLADQIKVIVAEMLERRIKDPRLGFVTVTDVRLTGDSREATVFYTVLGSDAEQAGTAAALRSATGLIRSQVGKQLGMKFTPTIELRPRRGARERPADRRSAGRRPTPPTPGWPSRPPRPRTRAKPTRTSTTRMTTSRID